MCRHYVYFCLYLWACFMQALPRSILPCKDTVFMANVGIYFSSAWVAQLDRAAVS